ncbi:MAG: hypothetical protein ACRECH_14375 [Nitrososphaerales archaeon]
MPDEWRDSLINRLALLGVVAIVLLLTGLTAYTHYLSPSSSAFDAIQDYEVWIVIAASLLAIVFVIAKSSRNL